MGKNILDVPTERQVQRSILSMMSSCFRAVYVAHVPNGAHLAGTNLQRAAQMAALRADGLRPGFPDLLCLWANAGVAMMEVKRPKLGRVEPAQVATHDLLRSLGVRVEVVTSQEDAYRFLNACGAPRSAQLMGCNL